MTMWAILFLATCLLPPWFVLILGYPLSRFVASRFDMPPIISLGGLDLWVSDLLLLGVGFRVLSLMVTRDSVRRRIQSSMRPGLLAFICVTTVTTIIAGLRFDMDIFYGELISWGRYLLNNILVLIFMAASLDSEPTLKKAMRLFRLLGYLAAGSIFVSALLYPKGTVIGEVNVGYEYVRHQGFFGDSVKLMLLPFILIEVAFNNYLGAAILVSALFITGGRAGLIVFILSFIIFGYATKWRFVSSRRKLILFLSLLCLVGILGWNLNWGGMATRFQGWQMEQGLAATWAGWLTAMRMISDHFLLGVGFQGYRFFADTYETTWKETLPILRTEAASQLFKVAIDSGIIGFFAFLWMMLDFTRVTASLAFSTSKWHSLGKAAFSVTLTLLSFSLIGPWMLPASLVSYVYFILLAFCVAIQVNRASVRLFIKSSLSVRSPING